MLNLSSTGRVALHDSPQVNGKFPELMLVKKHYVEATGHLKTIAVIKSMLFNTIENLILVPFTIQ